MQLFQCFATFQKVRKVLAKYACMQDEYKRLRINVCVFVHCVCVCVCVCVIESGNEVFCVLTSPWFDLPDPV